MKKTSGSSSKGESPSRLIDARIQGLDDWRGEMLSKLRALIKQADPAVVSQFESRRWPQLPGARARVTAWCGTRITRIAGGHGYAAGFLGCLSPSASPLRAKIASG